MVHDDLVDYFLSTPRNCNEPAWLRESRETAMDVLARLGLPTPRLEAWRFNNHRALRASLAAAATQGAAPSEASLAPYHVDGAAHRVVFVDGAFAPARSSLGKLPPGVWLATLGEALQTRPDLAQAAFAPVPERSFAALNTGLATDGIVLAIDPGVSLQAPLELIQYRASGGPPVQLRHVISLAADAEATIVETVAGAGSGSSNIVTVTTLGDRAKLNHVKLLDESDSALHLALNSAKLEAHASLTMFYLVLGGALSRHEADVALAGPKSRLVLNGCACLTGTQEATIAPSVDHQATGSETSELFKYVLDGHAHGVFLGSILVREGADGTQAHQQNRNLLVSPTARVDTKPELMIHADEVKCSHGATVGDLDENSLFYLMARGIAPETARRMLIEAFGAEAIDRTTLPAPVRDWLHTHLERRIGVAGEPS